MELGGRKGRELQERGFPSPSETLSLKFDGYFLEYVLLIVNQSCLKCGNICTKVKARGEPELTLKPCVLGL